MERNPVVRVILAEAPLIHLPETDLFDLVKQSNIIAVTLRTLRCGEQISLPVVPHERIWRTRYLPP